MKGTFVRPISNMKFEKFLAAGITAFTIGLSLISPIQSAGTNVSCYGTTVLSHGSVWTSCNTVIHSISLFCRSNSTREWVTINLYSNGNRVGGIASTNGQRNYAVYDNVAETHTHTADSGWFTR